MFAVVTEVTTLAHGLEVLVAAVLRHVIKMRDREHDLTLCPLRHVAIDLYAAARSASCPMQAALTDAFALAASTGCPTPSR